MSAEKKTVFILGAGASAAAGVPLMRDFLDVAHDLRRSIIGKPFQADYDAVFQGIDALQGVFAKSYLDLQNVESVFAAFEVGDLLGKLGDLEVAKIEQVSHHMRRLILSVIQETTVFNSGQRLIPLSSPEPYDAFVALLLSLHKKGHKITIITFNYDLALDYALERYMFAETFENIDAKVLKLHGSLHWYKCSNKNCLQLNELSLRHFHDEFDAYFSPSTSGFRLRLLGNERIQKSLPCNRCTRALVNEPLIVPPTWNKTQYFNEISHVWRDAAQELSGAENIFVCGYSLPDTDVFFKYLFAIGTIGHQRLRRFWVFNPDDSLETRFRTLLGAGVLNRFRYVTKTFGQSFDEIGMALGSEI